MRPVCNAELIAVARDIWSRQYDGARCWLESKPAIINSSYDNRYATVDCCDSNISATYRWVTVRQVMMDEGGRFR